MPQADKPNDPAVAKQLCERLRLQKIKLDAQLASMRAATEGTRKRNLQLSAELATHQTDIDEKRLRFRSAIHKEEAVFAALAAASIYKDVQRGGGTINHKLLEIVRPSTDLLAKLGALLTERLTTVLEAYDKEQQVLSNLQHEVHELRDVAVKREKKLTSSQTTHLDKPAALPGRKLPSSILNRKTLQTLPRKGPHSTLVAGIRPQGADPPCQEMPRVQSIRPLHVNMQSSNSKPSRFSSLVPPPRHAPGTLGLANVATPSFQMIERKRRLAVPLEGPSSAKVARRVSSIAVESTGAEAPSTLKLHPFFRACYHRNLTSNASSTT